MQQETKSALDGADAVEKGQEPSVKVDTATQGAGELKRQAGLEAPQSQKTSEQLAAEQLAQMDAASAEQAQQKPSAKVDTAAQEAEELERQAGLEAQRSQKTSEQLAAEQLAQVDAATAEQAQQKEAAIVDQSLQQGGDHAEQKKELVMEGDEVVMNEGEREEEAEEREKARKKEVSFRGEKTRWCRQKLPGKVQTNLQAGVFKTDWFTADTEMLKKYQPRNAIAGWETMSMEERAGPVMREVATKIGEQGKTSAEEGAVEYDPAMTNDEMIFAIVMELVQSKIKCNQQAGTGKKPEKLNRVKQDRAKFRLVAQTFALFANDKEEMKEMKEVWLKELEEMLPVSLGVAAANPRGGTVSRGDGLLTAQLLLACILEMPRAELVKQLDRITDFINRFMDNQIDEELVPELMHAQDMVLMNIMATLVFMIDAGKEYPGKAGKMGKKAKGTNREAITGGDHMESPMTRVLNMKEKQLCSWVFKEYDIMPRDLIEYNGKKFDTPKNLSKVRKDLRNWAETTYEAADRVGTVDLTKDVSEPEAEKQTGTEDSAVIIEMGYQPRQVMVLEAYVRTPGEMNTMINFSSEVVKQYRQIFSTMEMKKLVQRNPALKQFKVSEEPLFNGDDKSLTVSFYAADAEEEEKARVAFIKDPPVLRENIKGVTKKDSCDLILVPRARPTEVPDDNDTMEKHSQASRAWQNTSVTSKKCIWCMFLHGVRDIVGRLSMPDDAKVDLTVWAEGREDILGKKLQSITVDPQKSSRYVMTFNTDDIALLDEQMVGDGISPGR
jgi:hypothetical protein